jgi:hypothetical protein
MNNLLAYNAEKCNMKYRKLQSIFNTRNRTSLIGVLIVSLILCNEISAQQKHAGKSKFMSYKGLVMAGYQGWFNTEGDGANRGWTHYWKKGKFEDGSCTIDYWPEMDEYKVKYKTSFKFPDGSPAYVFSSYDESTVDLHFRWMKEYGIDGVFIQRFFSVLTQKGRINHNDKVLRSAVKAANKYGIAVALMYDIGSMDDSKYELIFDDWKHVGSLLGYQCGNKGIWTYP